LAQTVVQLWAPPKAGARHQQAPPNGCPPQTVVLVVDVDDVLVELVELVEEVLVADEVVVVDEVLVVEEVLVDEVLVVDEVHAVMHAAGAPSPFIERRARSAA